MAAEPESYFRPHRHPDPGKWELFLVLRGAAAVILLEKDGAVLDRTELSAAGPVRAAEVPPGVWHTLAVLEKRTLLFEVKPGPYAALSDKDFAPWSPEEGSPPAQPFVSWLRSARRGDPPPSPGQDRRTGRGEG